MKLRTLIVIAGILASGCTSLGSTHLVATPWALAGAHSFGVEGVEPAKMPSADRAISKMLDEASLETEIIVAGR